MPTSIVINTSELQQRAGDSIAIGLGIADLLARHPDLTHRAIITGSEATKKVAKVGATSLMGTAIVLPVGFGAVQYQRRLNGEVVQDSFPGLELPPATVVSFARAKRLVETTVPGRDGDVRECTGFTDWQIEIRGVWVNDENQDEPPEQGIRDLRDLFETPVAIPMLCDMCEWLGIYEVVIKDLKLPDIEGFPGVQPFTLSAVSDTPFEFKIKRGL